MPKHPKISWRSRTLTNDGENPETLANQTGRNPGVARISGTSTSPATTDTMHQDTSTLMERVLEKKNLGKAYKRVVSNNGASQGYPVKAAMGGRVSATGYDANSGNYIVLAHHSGYRPYYAHLDVIRVKVGEVVKTGERIGDVGSTGLSTGSHPHFSVFKNGVIVNPRSLMW